MKIIVAGGSGFVGNEVLRILVERNFEVTALAHSDASANSIRRDFPSISTITCDVSKKEECDELTTTLSKHDAIIYLPGLLREFPSKDITFQGVHVSGVRNLLAVAEELQISRWLQMSALGVSAEAKTPYYSTKWEAEGLVRKSKLDWTIFRPSVIFTDKPDNRINFVGELSNVLRSSPVLPVFGDGKYRMQPVDLTVVATAMVDSLLMPETIGVSYEIGGPNKIPYQEILRMISIAQGKAKPALHIPFFLVESVATLLDRFSFFPLTRDQLAMLKHENIVHDPEKQRLFESTFNPKQVRLSETLKGYFR